MEVVGVQFFRGDEQAPWFLQYSPGGDRIQCPVGLTLMDVETQARTKAHGTDNGMICTSVLVRHDAHARRVFVDENVVGPLVWAV